MTDATDLAVLLGLSASAYNRRDWLKIDPDEQARRCRQLASYNVLSAQALAAIFDVGTTRVETMVGHPIQLRGTLNPKHISLLAYALSNHMLLPETLKRIVDNGTSLNTIERLTMISRSTLNRRMRD
jgi:hypothetical protein